MIRVAPEGRPFIAAAAAVLLGLIGLGAAAGCWWPAAAWLPVLAWVVAFFRDPPRPGPRGEGLVIAPADGKVVSVLDVDEPAFHKTTVRRVSIFMNVFDCHVNRYPVSGTVAWRHYHAGQFLNAAVEKASLENEQASIGLETARGRVLVRQIAGLVARRIITDHEVGHQAAQGDRLGMIRFGSRVDVFLPAHTRVRVAEGDRTTAGVTVIAEWT